MEPYQAASPSNRNMIFTWIVRRALHVNAILIKSQSHYAVMLYIFFGGAGREVGQRGLIVKISHLKIMPVFSCFIRVTFHFHIFHSFVVELIVPIFSCLHTVYLKQPAFPPQKSNDCPHCRGVRHAMPSCLASIILSFFQTETTCHRKLYRLRHRLPIIKLS